MKYILQVFTGDWHHAENRPGEIIRKIGEISSRIPVDKVIIGWYTDASVYRKVGAFLHRAGMKMLLWLPVFSEVGKISEQDKALDLFGNPVSRPIGQEGDDFVFGCPSSDRNIQAVLDIYEKHFSGCGFDGVFLDRIRSQSFASGVSGVLSCGCGRCRAAFLKRGVDTEAVRELYAEKKDAFFDMDDYPTNGMFRLKNALAQQFFEAKEEIIADAVTEICRYFKDRGMIVGMDLFAPVVSRFVGQNYPLITGHADFIKPMLYRRTEAPAGIGYEYGLFKKTVPGALGRLDISMDRSFLDTQLEAAGQAACECCPGIEINYSENIVKTDAGYVTESLTEVRDYGFKEAVLCWNILQVPEEHIEAVAGLDD